VNRKALLLVTLLLPASLSSTAEAGAKVAVCHVNGNGSIKMLNINVNAEDAHLDHGDWSPDTWYADNDGDGYGDPGAAAESCEQPDGFVDNADDLDDTDATSNDAQDEEFDPDDGEGGGGGDDEL